VTSPLDGFDVLAHAGDLVSALLAQPWGHTSASTYETGRLVTLAPWLTGHAARLEFLIAAQGPDGRWGGPDGYAIVPTLSATEALLSTVVRDADAPGLDQATRARIVTSAQHGLVALFTLLDAATPTSLPDTPAVEIITPALVALVNQHLDGLSDSTNGLGGWPGQRRLSTPDGTDTSLLRTLRAALAAGQEVPDKLLHALEILGDAAGDMTGIEPTAIAARDYSTVGASPASTAAWLVARGLTTTDHPARRFLDAVAARFGGPVPSVFPITVFERSWVLNALAQCGVAVTPPRGLIDSLDAALGTRGAPGGPGLPPDADSTSMVLLTLSQLDRSRGLELLRPFETDTHFRTWAGERTPSPTVNAHVLDAFGAAPGGPESAWHAEVIEKTSAWLRGAQLPDGYWQDKWHASAFYATARCALALNRHGGLASVPAVRRAVDWVLATQRADGSWGRWGGTVEETAYGIQVLLLTRPAASDAVGPAAARAYRYLCASFNETKRPPLWHDKDLYSPEAIVSANVLGAMHVARSDRTVGSLLANV
jgi:hypothetical protein